MENENLNLIKRHGLRFWEKSSDKDGEYYVVAKELIENLFFDLSKVSTKFSNEDYACDMPYVFSERRIDSVLLPALAKLCDSIVLTEMPTQRCCSNRHFNVEQSNGRIDYWCVYKGFSFVIELKHSFDCFTTSKTGVRRVTARWDKMNEQLESVKADIKQYGDKTKGIVRIGLHMITSYTGKCPSKQLVTQFRQSVPDTFERFSKDFGKRFPSLRPDLILCWNIPEKIVLDGGGCTYPGLWMLAKIFPPILHRGHIK